jgi:hypothetical protein
MVGVEMRQDDGRDGRDTHLVQASIHGLGVGAGVDHDSRSLARTQEQGVALADVAHDHEPGRRRPTSSIGRKHRPEDDTHDDHGNPRSRNDRRDTSRV